MNDDITITKLFLDTCNKYTDRTALQLYKPAGIEKYSYRQIKESALKIAEFLKSENTGTNNFVAIILDNCPEWSMIYFGIVCAGMCAVPIDSQLTDEEKENLISDCGTKIIFTSDGLSKIVVLAGTKASRKSFTFKSILSGRITAAEGQTPEVKPEDIASLIYTSGTTAKPKGVCLTHYNLCSNFLSIQKLGICKPEDNIISILPLYHTYSFMVTLLVPFFTGAVITYPPGLKSDDLINTLRDCKVTILVGVPQLFYLIHKAIFSKIQAMPFFVRPFLMPLVRSKVRKRLGKSLALLVSGGARLEPEVARDFVSLGFKFTEGYGLTETSPVVTFNPPGKPKFGSVGKTIPDVEIKIYNPDKSGIGEVLVNGPNVMKGYFNRPDLTAEVIKDRWFYTGDLGYIDSDGYLYIAGRKKDVIVLSSGKNIYPEEIEEHYGQIPYIKEICVFEKNNLLYAVIVPDTEYFHKTQEINVSGKIRWELENYSKRIAPYKRIMGFIISKKDLPRTRLKKIKRYEVEYRYGKEITPEYQKELLSEEDYKLLETTVAEKIIDHLSRTLKRKVNLNDHLEIDLGIDSLGRVELAVALESLLKIEIPDSILISVFTVKELIVEINNIAKKEITDESKDVSINWGNILKQKPRDEVTKKIELYPGTINRMLTILVKNSFLLLLKLFWSLKIENKNNVPVDRPIILCPNHSSFLDGFIVMCSVPYRCAQKLFFFGHRDYFDKSLIAWCVKIARIISIAPSLHLVDAMQSASFVLNAGKSLCIFPEGELSIDGSIKTFKKGIGILSRELNITLVPVLIQGSFFAWARGMQFPKFSRIRIIFGKPVTPDELLTNPGGSAEDDYQTIASNLRERIIELTR